MAGYRYDTVIIGGGIGGLMAAYRLRKKEPNMRTAKKNAQKKLFKFWTRHIKSLIWIKREKKPTVCHNKMKNMRL